MSQYSPQLETGLFQAVILYKPFGLDYNFILLNIQIYIKRQFGIDLTFNEITGFLQTYYDILKQDELEIKDFELPFEEYEDLIAPRRFSNVNSEDEIEDQTIKKKRKTKKKGVTKK